MNRIVAFLLCMTVCVWIGGCGGSEPAPASGGGSSSGGAATESGPQTIEEIVARRIEINKEQVAAALAVQDESGVKAAVEKINELKSESRKLSSKAEAMAKEMAKDDPDAPSKISNTLNSPEYLQTILARDEALDQLESAKKTKPWLLEVIAALMP